MSTVERKPVFLKRFDTKGATEKMNLRCEIQPGIVRAPFFVTACGLAIS
jgi:hypothetical protein